MSRTVSAAAAKTRFADCLRDAENGTPVIITRYGRPVAAMVGAGEIEKLERLRAARPETGLAGLVGLWPDGDEFADVVEASGRGRSPERDAPVFE